jgi:hypothetical protein
MMTSVVKSWAFKPLSAIMIAAQLRQNLINTDIFVGCLAPYQAGQMYNNNNLLRLFLANLTLNHQRTIFSRFPWKRSP